MKHVLRILALCLTVMILAVLTLSASAEIEVIRRKTIRTYNSPTLQFSIEQFEAENARCFLTHIWMEDPGRQIVKAEAEWETALALPSDMVEKLPVAPALVLNGSGYVSPAFPEIYPNYPGTSEDYYYTPLGSLTITDGLIHRNLPGVPFYGLTLQSDGLHMHVGEDNEEILAQNPTQTWSFYVECPVIRDGVSILDPDWRFTNTRHIRNIICKLDDHNYAVLTVSAKLSAGWTMATAVEFLLQDVHPIWAYNLDGGPSATLLARTRPGGVLKTIYGNGRKDADIMAFVE